jgi:hypothetical protein
MGASVTVDRHSRNADLCLPCHPCLSPFTEAFLLGVTPVTLFSSAEAHVWIGAEKSGRSDSKGSKVGDLHRRVPHLYFLDLPRW